ncbi:MAG: NAD(P)-dependent alcohol dehydrogenase [Spirochaetia bacterium]|nr:NAD(P)-dependent alcohol dehydrogenase [Spirochaetia bacterium]
MKAILYESYGSPDILRLKDVEKPVPKEGEVLVKVVAASANPLDWHLMRGEPFIARLIGGLRRPKNPKLGADLAGRVEGLGKNAGEFKIGDAVFGSTEISELGAFGEWTCIPEKLLVLKPAKLSFEEAAAVPVAAYTALQGLRDKGQIKPGQKVLVNGASGGVGHFAVQIAKAYGTEVTGVCSKRNLDLVRSIGADHVIDYTKEDFTRGGKRYDLVFDAVGNLSIADFRRVLNRSGIGSVAGFTSLSLLFQTAFLGACVSLVGKKKIGLMKTAEANQKDLLFLKNLLETGKIKPVIDRTYPLNETSEAIRYLETSRARGKVIVRIGDEK